MQRLLRCDCCCRREQPDELDDGAITGSYWSIWQSREQFKPNERGTLSTIVTTEPSANATATPRNVADDLVDIEFPQGSYEDVRYGDMSATIFKRQHT